VKDRLIVLLDMTKLLAPASLVQEKAAEDKNGKAEAKTKAAVGR
jgi:hypothetical protein